MFYILQKGLIPLHFEGEIMPLTWLIAGAAATFIIGYLLGSINFALVISKVFYNDDIRNHGSKGAGMTNMLRTYGKKAAAFTLLGDILKTVVAVFIGALLLGGALSAYGSYYGGLASIIGHVFPLYYGFKGGKGVASAAAMVLFTDPVVFLILFVIFVAVVAMTKYISLGSIVAIMFYPIVLNRINMLLWPGEEFVNLHAGQHTLIAFALGIFIVFLHRANIKRLRNGEENKVSFKSKKKESE